MLTARKPLDKKLKVTIIITAISTYYKKNREGLDSVAALTGQTGVMEEESTGVLGGA
jgi:hypothetical protein